MLEIIHGCLFCETKEEFLSIMEEFKKLVYFDYSSNEWGGIPGSQDEKTMFAIINGGCPEEFLQIYCENGYHRIDHVLQKYLETFDLQNFLEIDKMFKDDSENPVIKLGNDFGIYKGYLFGVPDCDFKSSTAFFLSGPQMENDQRTKVIIKQLIPHLSITLKRLLPFPVDGKIIQLTTTEREVLQWVKEGKTTWETSLIMKKSERAIKFHVYNILKKLNAVNKTHAVAIALENHLIKL